MGASRRAFLSQLGRSKGFQVEDVFSEKVTHVISENNTGHEVRTWLDSQYQRHRKPVQLLDISWYTENMRAGRPTEILDRHRLQDQPANQAEDVVFSVPSYACQRRTTLQDHNTIFTNALSVLAENAELSNEEGRSIAFRRAAAVLKALPAPVRGMAQLRGLPCLGEHSLRVIHDILASGTSDEVESAKQSARYKAVKILTGIFGVGPKTADRWFREGIHSLQQLQQSGHALNRAQQAGLEHYNDINQPVTKLEADAICETVRKAVGAVLPDAQITLTGGFRRGKLTGHDVDFLITHPEEGREEGLMHKVISWLESRGFLLYQKTTRNLYLQSTNGPGRPASNMDRSERCLSIFKLAKQQNHGAEQACASKAVTVQEARCAECDAHLKGSLQESHQYIHAGAASHPHPSSETKCDQSVPCQHEGAEAEETQAAGYKAWRAVRVDLVVSPISQFAFALLGWTGSKLFERELRRWAGHEKNMSLSSHALYDNKKNQYLRVTSEEEIFAYLGLDYITPTERNA
ncbi:DNA-directed DNA/RNA polymerase mu isoform X1 [Thalassophryne amazonica]|uniref:DNA-directed DNA/RNA polymerase mu isoform X1 n=1 Tax=Thalassophryne amazonica TaxID=390379 RepID=UPI0014709484|nr:DNA-directed DNA/RNA polymerase mu isoform X1 [Thalassophryne amazonica]